MAHKSEKDSFHRAGKFKPFSYKLLIELFPFCLILNKHMNVVSCGSKINEIWRGTKLIYDQPITNYFKLRRPKGIAFTWKNVRSKLSFIKLLVIFSHNWSVIKFAVVFTQEVLPRNWWKKSKLRNSNKKFVCLFHSSHCLFQHIIARLTVKIRRNNFKTCCDSPLISSMVSNRRHFNLVSSLNT